MSARRSATTTLIDTGDADSGGPFYGSCVRCGVRLVRKDAAPSRHCPPCSQSATLPVQGPWSEEALCAQVDPERWFPEDSSNAAVAKQVCRTCPVRLPCLEYAMATNEQHGVWGGLSRTEREVLARTRKSLAEQDAA